MASQLTLNHSSSTRCSEDSGKGNRNADISALNVILRTHSKTTVAGDSIPLPLPHRPLAHQAEVGLESGSVAGAGIELDSGGKQSASIEASSCLPLAFCCLSQAFSSLS